MTGDDEEQPRRAQVAEAVAVAELWWRSRWASVPANPPPVHDHEDVHDHFATVILPGQETWVIDGAAGRLAALLVLRPGWVEHLMVDPARSGQGLGSRLLRLAQQVEPNGLDLWTFQGNAAARRFYERHGFVAVAATDGDNEECAPDVRYRWPAPPG